jgi:uncharacterized protein with HEPN domain
MSEGDLLYIEHIKQSISKVRKYLKGMDRDTFLSDEKTQDAVIRQFEVIGEASKRLSPLRACISYCSINLSEPSSEPVQKSTPSSSN